MGDILTAFKIRLYSARNRKKLGNEVHEELKIWFCVSIPKFQLKMGPQKISEIKKDKNFSKLAVESAHANSEIATHHISEFKKCF